MPDIQPLDEDLLRDLREYEADGLALLQLDASAKPLAIVTRINEHTRSRWRDAGQSRRGRWLSLIGMRCA